MVSGGFVACGWVCFAVGVVRARFGWAGSVGCDDCTD